MQVARCASGEQFAAEHNSSAMKDTTMINNISDTARSPGNSVKHSKSTMSSWVYPTPGVVATPRTAAKHEMVATPMKSAEKELADYVRMAYPRSLGSY